MEFNIEKIKEYEKKYGVPYELWDNSMKIGFLQQLYYEEKIKALDNYVETQSTYDYDKKLKEYLDLGFEVLYSRGDQNHPIRDDLEEIFQNEKIIYHRDTGVIGNIVKVDDRKGKISLRPFDFYYEIKRLSNGKIATYESRQTGYGEIHEIKRIIEDYNLNTPWRKANDELLLTRQLHGTPATTREIISTFDEDVIDALGYQKAQTGKIYVKKHNENH